RRAITANDQGARHAAGDLQRGRAMTVGVIPEGAGRVIRGDIVFVGEPRLRIDRQQDVVAVAGRAYPQSVGMEIGAVEAMRNIRHLRPRHAAGITGLRTRGQRVVEGDAHRIAGNCLNRRRNKWIVRIDTLSGITSQTNLVVAILRRIIDLTVDILDLEIELTVTAYRLRASGDWRGGGQLLEGRL